MRTFEEIVGEKGKTPQLKLSFKEFIAGSKTTSPPPPKLRFEDFINYQPLATPSGPPRGPVSPDPDTPDFVDTAQRPAPDTGPQLTQGQPPTQQELELTRRGAYRPRTHKEEVGRGIGRGVRQIGAAHKSLLGMGAGMAGQPGYQQRMLQEAGQLTRGAEKATMAPSVGDLREVRGVRDVGKFLEGRGSEQIPIAGGMALSGPLAPLAAIAHQTGSIYQDVTKRAGTGPWQTGVAIGLGTLTGMLDALPIMRLIKKGGAGKQASKYVVNGLIKKGLLKRVGKEMVIQGSLETATEGLQTVGEQLAGEFVDKNHKMFSKENAWEIANAMALGLAGGAVGGGGVGTAVSVLPNIEAQGPPPSAGPQPAPATPTGPAVAPVVPPIGEGPQAAPPQFPTAPTAAETPPGPRQTIGRPELANPMETEKSRAGMNLVDQARKDAGVPVKESMKDWEAKGAAIAADPVRRRATKDRLSRGEMLDKDESEGAKIILHDMAGEAFVQRDKEALAELIHLEQGWREGGTEHARAMRDRADRIAGQKKRLSEYFYQGLTRLPKQTAKEYAEARANGDTDTTVRIEREWADKIDAMLADWTKRGIDVQNADNASVRQLGKMFKDMAYAVGGTNGWDAAHEHVRNSVMSQKSMIRNFGGGLYAPWDAFVVKPTKRLIDSLLPGGKKHTGESMAAWHAGTSKIAHQRAWSYAFWSWVNEVPIFNLQVGHKTGHWEAESHKPPSITGRWLGKQAGKVMGPGVGEATRKTVAALGHAERLLQRTNLAVDQLFQSLHSHAEVAAHAVQAGKEQGLKPYTEEMQAFVDAQLEDLSSDSWSAAMESGESQRVVYLGEPGKVEQGILDLREAIPPLKLFPFIFVHTPVMLARQAGISSVTGTPYVGVRALRGGYKGQREVLTRHLAQQALAWAGTLALWGLTGDDEEPGYITGPASNRPQYRGEQHTTGTRNPDMALRLSKTGPWHSYKYNEPFSAVLGTHVALITLIKNLRKGRSTKEEVTHTFNRLKGMYADQTYIKGIGDIIKAIDDPERYGQNVWRNLGEIWLPNVIEQAITAQDDYIRNNRVMGEEGERASYTESVLRKSIPVTSLLPPPRVGLWGQDIMKNPDFDSPTGTFLYRTLWPSFALVPTRGKTEEVEKLLMHYNYDKPPDKRYWIYEPTRYVTLPDEASRKGTDAQEMNEDEYYLFAKLSGLYFRQAAEFGIWKPDKPTDDQVTEIEQMVKSGREMARSFIQESRDYRNVGNEKAAQLALARMQQQIRQLEQQFGQPGPGTLQPPYSRQERTTP